MSTNSVFHVIELLKLNNFYVKHNVDICGILEKPDFCLFLPFFIFMEFDTKMEQSEKLIYSVIIIHFLLFYYRIRKKNISGSELGVVK